MAQNTLIDFYPTPWHLIEKLTEGLKLREVGAILEPSGGKGDICDYIKKRTESDYYRKSEADIDVIEINPELQALLRGKEYRVIHDDFLTFQTRKAYDLIVANFPFGEGDRHLEHALCLLTQRGGKLRCIINAETLKNPYTNLRKMLVNRLEELGAEIEYLASEFESAERKTSVEIALIKLEVERPEPFSIILDSLKPADDAHAESYASHDLTETDFLKSIVAHFDMECDTGIRLIREYYALKPHIKDALQRPKGDHDSSSLLIKLEIKGRSAGISINGDINSYLRGVRKKYWEALIHDPRFTSQYTSNILKELSRKLDELKDYDFTAFNIRQLQKDLETKVIAGVEQAIIDLFETCSRTHAYGEDFGTNIWYYNGWKTNKAHKINKKIILPMYGLRADWSGRGSKIEYDFADKLNDMVKVFNYLSRDKADVPRLVGNAVACANSGQDFNLDLRYFKIKLFKKGTAHITFTDLELLDKFNIFGGQRKNWLPPSYGKKRYAEMSQEERQIVDDFQGKESYEKVMRDPEFYLVDAKQLLLAA